MPSKITSDHCNPKPPACHRCGAETDDLKPWGKTEDEWICFDCWMVGDGDVCARLYIHEEDDDA